MNLVLNSLRLGYLGDICVKQPVGYCRLMLGEIKAEIPRVDQII